MSKDDYILEMDNVSKEFPGVKALSNVSFKVKRGEIHGICGENGAGKSTLMKILSGVYGWGSYEGTILFNGRVLQNRRVRDALEQGIGIVYQELALVPHMTVGENIFLGREPKRAGSIHWHKLYAETDKILKQYGLDIPFSSKVSNLGVGKQQMVEIAKALSEEAKLLILDEPTSALTEKESEVLMGILRRLKESGVTCLYISHKLEEIFEITDSITVIRDGKAVSSFETAKSTTESLISLMVGRTMTDRFPPRDGNPGAPLLEVEHITSYSRDMPDKKRVDRVSFSVRAGEIFGISGLMGSGRTELVKTIFGEYGIKRSGRVVLEGREIKINSARDAMDNHISLVPEDRKGEGLVLMQSILQNISLPNIKQFSTSLTINKHKELYECEKMSRKVSVKTPSLHAPVDTLSGGNQQKAVIAKSLLAKPKVLILDEPTRGIDVGAKFEIYKLMNQLAREGVAIIMVSSEMPELLGMCDRILVMHEGRCTGILTNEEATQENIMTLATGYKLNGTQ